MTRYGPTVSGTAFGNTVPWQRWNDANSCWPASVSLCLHRQGATPSKASLDFHIPGQRCWVVRHIGHLHKMSTVETLTAEMVSCTGLVLLRILVWRMTFLPIFNYFSKRAFQFCHSRRLDKKALCRHSISILNSVPIGACREKQIGYASYT